MGNYFEYHSVAEPAVFFRWALWSRQAILKANATMDGFLAANGIPIFLQLQDNSGFTAEETEAFYIKFERKIAAAMMNEYIGF